MERLEDIPTPAAVVDLDKLEANIAAMAGRCADLGVHLRPHLKTHKCVEIAGLQREAGARGVTVATIFEARVFADAGFDDITWAFPLIPSRLSEVAEVAGGTRLGVVVDSDEAIDALAAARAPVRVWLKIDCGYHRAGVAHDSARPGELLRRVEEAGLSFAGVLSHSGDAYDVPGTEARRAAAERERSRMVALAERLRTDGHAVEEVSVGSTPAMTAVERLEGVTEARPGNYAFFDGMQVGLGSCAIDDCALTVIASVVSRGARHSVIDAGALALSKDPGLDGTTMGEIFADYPAGKLDDELRVASVSQEHGKLTRSLPVGTRVRVLPNHSCLTAACFTEYVVARGEAVVDRWKVWNGR